MQSPVGLLLLCTVLALLAAPCTSQGSSAACRAVNSFSYSFLAGDNTLSSQLPIDGFPMNVDFGDLSWLLTLCSNSNPESPISYASGWMDSNYSSVPSFLPRTLGLSGKVQFSRALSATFDSSSNQISISASIIVLVPISGTVLSKPTSFTMRIDLFKSLTGVLVEYVPYFQFPWQGSLYLDGSVDPIELGLYVQDVNVFDGAPASVLGSVSIPSVSSFGPLDSLVSIIGDLPRRLDWFGAVPSALRASIRGAFLPASQLPSVSSATTAQQLYGGVLYLSETESFSSTPGILVQSVISCDENGGPGCNTSGSVAASFAQIRDAALVSSQVSIAACPEVNGNGLPLDSLGQLLSLDSFLSNDTILIKALSGLSYGLMSCGSNSKIDSNTTLVAGISLLAQTASSVSFPMDLFISSPKTTVGLVQSVPIMSSGCLRGYFQNSSHLFRFPSLYDLFSGDVGGVLVPDTPMGSPASINPEFFSIISGIFNGITSLSSTPSSAANALFDEILAAAFPGDVSAIQSLMDEYLDASISSGIPSLVDFLQWYFAKQENIASIHLKSAGDAFEAHVFLARGISDQNSLDTTSAGEVDAVISSFGTMLIDEFSLVSGSIPTLSAATSLSASTQATLHATISISGLTGVDALGWPRIGDSLGSVSSSLVGPVQYSVITKCVAHFNVDPLSSDSIFSSVRVEVRQSSSAGELTPVSVISTALSPLTQLAVGSSSASLDSSGSLSTGFSISSSSMSSLLEEAGSSFSKYLIAQGGASPILALLDQVDESSPFESVFQFLADRVASFSESNIDAYDAAAALEDSFSQTYPLVSSAETSSTLSSSPSFVFATPSLAIIPTSSNSSIEFRLRSFCFQRTILDRMYTPWQYVLETTRLTIPVLLRLEVRFSLSSASETSSFIIYSVQGEVEMQTFSLPLVLSMQSATASQGALSISFNLPSSSPGSLVLRMSSDLDNQINSVLSFDLASQSMDLALNTSNNRQIPPSVVLANIRDGFYRLLPLTLNTTFGMPFPLMAPGSTLGAGTHIGQLASSFITWLSYPAFMNSAVASAPIANTSQLFPQTILMNVTINKMFYYACSFSVSSGDSVSTLANTLNAAFALCGASRLLVAQVDSENPTGDMGVLSLYGVHPGSLWSLGINSFSQDGVTLPQLFSSVSWTLQTVPVFASWQDVGWAFSAVTADLKFWSMPTFEYVEVGEITGLIPENLKEVYPARLPSMKMTFSLSRGDSPTYALVNQISSASNATVVNFENQKLTGQMLASVNGDVSFVFEAPPLGDGSNLFLFSSLNGSNITVPIPSAPQNSFDVLVVAELRGTNASVVRIDSKTSIVLPPGEPLLASLREALPAQVSDVKIRNLLSVGIASNYSSVLRTNPEIMISLRKYQILDGGIYNGSWVVPISLSFNNSQIPYFANCTNMPPDTRVLVSNCSLNVDGVFQSTSSLNASGSIGIIDFVVFSSGAAENVASTAVSISTNQRRNFEFLTTALSSSLNTSIFFSSFDARVSIDTFLSLGPVSIDVANTSLLDGNISMNFTQLDHWYLANRSDWWEMTQKVKHQNKLWDVTISGGSVVDSLGHLSNDTIICDILSRIVSTCENVTGQPESSAALPFAGTDFATIFSSGITAPFQATFDSLCSNGRQVETLSSLSRGLSSSFENYGSPVRLEAFFTSSEQFAVRLAASPYSKFATFSGYFDTEMLMNSTEIPSGTLVIPIGASSGYEFALEFLLDFPSSGSNFTISYASGSYFEASFSANATGQAPGVFGAVSLGFGNLNLLVGGPAAILRATPSSSYSGSNVDLSNSGSASISISGSASLNTIVRSFEGELLCGLNIQVPQLSDYLRGSNDGVSVQQFQCGSGFVSQVSQAAAQSKLLDYFEAPISFLTQYSSAMETLAFRLFYKKHLPVLPFVGTFFEYGLVKFLSDLLSPSRRTTLISQLVESTTTIDFSVMTEEEKETATLQSFTNIFNGLYDEILTSPVATPSYDPSGVYTWAVDFHEILSLPISELAYPLGHYGYAKFSTVQCNQMVNFDVHLSFVMHYNFKDGMTFELVDVSSSDPGVFVGEMTLEFSGSCTLDGYIGSMGAYYSPNSGKIQAVFSVDNSYALDLTVSAVISGPLELGFAGATKDIIGEYEMEALPHYLANLETSWIWSVDSPVVSPILDFRDLQVCVGRVLGHLIHDVVAEMNDWGLQSLNEVLGPDGILLTPVSGSNYLFGSTMNLLQILQMIADTFCSGSCVFSGVVQAVETFAQIIGMIDDLAQLQTIDPDGCGVTSSIQSVVFDFRQGSVSPQGYGPIPSNSLQYNTPSTQQHAGFIQNTWSNVIQGSGFGINFPLFQEPLSSLLDLIYGKDIPLVIVGIPKATVSIMVQFPIPIWPFPYVAIVLEAGAGLTIDVGQLMFPLSGLIDVISSHNPSTMFGNLAIEATDGSNSQHWPLTGSVTIGGGVTVSVIIFQGGAIASLTLEGMVGVPDLDGNGFATFDQIHYLIQENGGNILSSLDRKIEFLFGFRFYIQACINLIFWKHCWTVVNIQFQNTIWSDFWAPQNIPSVMPSDGNINLETYRGSFSMYNSYCGIKVDYNNAPDVPLSSCFGGLSKVGFSGDPTGTQLNMYGVHQAVDFPGSPSSTLNLDLTSYPSSSSYSLTQTKFTPRTASGVSISDCKSTTLQSSVPIYGLMTVAGNPCPVTVDAPLVLNLTITGDSDFYGTSKPFLVTGTIENLFCDVQGTKYIFYPTKLFVDDSFIVSSPNDMLSTTLYSNFHDDSTVSITALDAGCGLDAYGGSGDDTYEIPNFGTIDGALLLDGGLGHNQINMDVFGVDGQLITMTSTALVQSQHVVSWRNILQRNLTLYSGAQTNINVRYGPIESEAIVHVTSVGDPSSSVSQQVDGCSGTSSFFISLTNGGDQTVTLTHDGMVSGFFGCVVQITGSSASDQIDTVVIDASRDTNNLEWTLKDSMLSVYSPLNPATIYFQVSFTAIERFQVSLGGSRSTLVFGEGTLGTEFVFQFSDSGVGSNFAQVLSTTNPILLLGTYELQIGPDASSASPVDPFENINGMVAAVAPTLGSSSSPMTITLNSGALANIDMPLYFLMDSACFDPTDQASNVISMQSTPSSWFVGMMGQSGISDTRNCHLNFLNYVSFIVETGKGDDVFVAQNLSPNCGLDVSVGAGDDTVIVRDCPNANPAQFTFALGTGGDDITFDVPVFQSQVDFGDDIQADGIFVYSDGYPCSLNGAVISPVGPISGFDSIQILNYKFEDLILFQEGVSSLLPSPPLPSSSSSSSSSSSCSSTTTSPNLNSSLAAGRPLHGYPHATDFSSAIVSEINDPELGIAVVTVNANQNNGLVRVAMADDTLYDCIGLGVETVLVADARGDSSVGISPASNWIFEMDFTDTSNPGFIDIYGLQGTNGTVVINVPPADAMNTQVLLTQSSESIGVLFVNVLIRIQMMNIDHLIINAQTPTQFEITGTPAGCDLAIPTVSGSSILFHQLQNSVYVSNAACTFPETFVEANYPIVLQGVPGSASIYFKQPMSFVDGCMLWQSPSGQTILPSSTWFQGFLAQEGVSSAAIGCLLFTETFGFLSVAVDNIFVKGLGAQTVPSLDVLGQLVSLDDAQTWQSGLIANGLLVVDSSRYQIHLQPLVTSSSKYVIVWNGTMIVNPSLLTSNTTLTTNCSKSGEYMYYYFGSPSHPLTLLAQWNSAKCIGQITTTTAIEYRMPNLKFQEEELIPVQLSYFNTPSTNIDGLVLAMDQLHQTGVTPAQTFYVGCDMATSRDCFIKWNLTFLNVPGNTNISIAYSSIINVNMLPFSANHTRVSYIDIQEAPLSNSTVIFNVPSSFLNSTNSTKVSCYSLSPFFNETGVVALNDRDFVTISYLEHLIFNTRNSSYFVIDDTPNHSDFAVIALGDNFVNVSVKALRNSSYYYNANVSFDTSSFLIPEYPVVLHGASTIGSISYGSYSLSFIGGCVNLLPQYNFNHSLPTAWFQSLVSQQGVSPLESMNCSLFTAGIGSLILTTPSINVENLGTATVPSLNIFGFQVTIISDQIWNRGSISNGLLIVDSGRYEINLKPYSLAIESWNGSYFVNPSVLDSVSLLSTNCSKTGEAVSYSFGLTGVPLPLVSTWASSKCFGSISGLVSSNYRLPMLSFDESERITSHVWFFENSSSSVVGSRNFTLDRVSLLGEIGSTNVSITCLASSPGCMVSWFVTFVDGLNALTLSESLVRPDPAVSVVSTTTTTASTSTKTTTTTTASATSSSGALLKMQVERRLSGATQIYTAGEPLLFQLPHIYVDVLAMLHLNAPSDTSLVMPGAVMEFHGKSNSVSLRNDIKSTECLQPSQDCTLNAYVDIGAKGSQKCSTDVCKRQCMAVGAAYLEFSNTSLNMKCLYLERVSGYSVSVASNASSSSPGVRSFDFTMKDVSAAVYFLCVIPILLLDKLYLHPEMSYQTFVWAEFLISALMSSLNGNFWNLKFRSLLQGIVEVVENLFTNWVCLQLGFTAKQTVVFAVSFSVALLLVGLLFVDLVILGQRLVRPKAQHLVRIVHRVGTILAIFLLAPYCISHFPESHDALQLGLCIVTLVLLFGKSLFDVLEIFYPELRSGSHTMFSPSEMSTIERSGNGNTDSATNLASPSSDPLDATTPLNVASTSSHTSPLSPPVATSLYTSDELGALGSNPVAASDSHSPGLPVALSNLFIAPNKRGLREKLASTVFRVFGWILVWLVVLLTSVPLNSSVTHKFSQASLLVIVVFLLLVVNLHRYLHNRNNFTFESVKYATRPVKWALFFLTFLPFISGCLGIALVFLLSHHPEYQFDIFMTLWVFWVFLPVIPFLAECVFAFMRAGARLRDKALLRTDIDF